MSRAQRGLETHPDFVDLAGEWIGPLLVVNRVRREDRPIAKTGRALWRCHDFDTGSDRYLTTRALRRKQRAREAELAAHREQLAAEEVRTSEPNR